MFQFRRFPSHTYLIQYGMTGHDSGRIAPFRHLRINICLRFPAAFRSLPRLSSASDAKAFALRPYSLDPLRIIVFLQRFKFKIVVFPKLFVLFLTFDFSLYFAFLFVQFSSYRRQLSLPSSQLPLRWWAQASSHTPILAYTAFAVLRFGFLSACSFFAAFAAWWAQVDSNHRPHAYQACALTT